MKNILTAVIFLIISISIYSQTVSVFLLKSVDNELSIEKITLAENETKVFVKGTGSENISLILPVSIGISGDFSKAGDKSVMIARNKDGKLVISVQKPDGTQKELLAKTPDELKNCDIKVNVTGFTTKKVFNISGYDIVTEDSNAPVIDMFQGKIPLGEGDYSITTEITEHQDSFNLNGEFETEYHAGYYFTKIRLGNGKNANVIIDLGAAQSFLVKDVLPEGTEIRDVFAQEVSAEGTRAIDIPINGFGGRIENLTECEINTAEIGSLKLNNFTFYIIDSFKTVKGKRIEGIIGLDILSASGKMLFELPGENKTGRIILGSSAGNTVNFHSIPFAFSHGHIFIKGKAAGNDIQFILDTGSPFNFLSKQIAEKQNIRLESSIDVFGADGNSISTLEGIIEEIELNNYVFKNVKFLFANADLFERYGINSSGGIIGTELLKNFEIMEIDFALRILKLK